MKELSAAGRSEHRGALSSALFWVRCAVAAGLLALLVLLVPPREILAGLRGADPRYIALAFLIMFTGILLSSLKLCVLVRTAHPGASLLGVLRAYYVGTFFNNFLPTSVGGDVLKINELRSQGIPVRHGTASVVVERATGVLVVLVLAVVVALARPDVFTHSALRPMRWPLLAVGAGPLLLLAACYALWRVKLKPFLKGKRDGRAFGKVYWVVESFYVFRNRPGAMLLVFGVSAVFYALIAVNMALVAQGLGAGVTLKQAGGILPLVKIPEMMPVSVGGLGVSEGALTYCLAHVSAETTAAQAAAVALLMRFLMWVHSAIGGLVYAVGGRRGPRHES